MPSSSNRRRRRGPKNANSVDRQIAASHHSSSRGNVLSVAADFTARRQNFNLVQRPPKNFLTQIHWIQSNYQYNSSVSAGTFEYNFAFMLNQINDYASYVAVFDQFCIYSAAVRCISNTEFTGTNTLGSLATAIDYDNISAIASWSAIQDFSTCNVCQVEVGQSVERYIKPCVSPALFNTSGFNAYGISRMWVDTNSSATPHYGFRSYFNGVVQTYTMLYNITLTIGFRNNI